MSEKQNSSSEYNQQSPESYEDQQLWLLDQQAEMGEWLERAGVYETVRQIAADKYGTDVESDLTRLVPYFRTEDRGKARLDDTLGVCVIEQNMDAWDHNLRTGEKTLDTSARTYAYVPVVRMYAENGDFIPTPGFTLNQARLVATCLDYLMKAKRDGKAPDLSHDMTKIVQK